MERPYIAECNYNLPVLICLIINPISTLTAFGTLSGLMRYVSRFVILRTIECRENNSPLSEGCPQATLYT